MKCNTGAPMRLTLRTMLAYMDEILEPEDQEKIGQKIEESPFATDLVRRTRDIVRRLRVGAPPLSAESAGMDANTVAEYLDNSMESERVADFERVCLESDVYLAEVAACHQVLTLVLGQPAEVDADAQQRMYRILDEPHAAGAATGPPGDVGGSRYPDGSTVREDSGDAGESARARRRPEVPEYLRASSGRRWARAVAAVAACVALIAVVGLIAARWRGSPTASGQVAARQDPREQPSDGMASDDEPSNDYRSSVTTGADTLATPAAPDGKVANDRDGPVAAAPERTRPAPPSADPGAGQPEPPGPIESPATAGSRATPEPPDAIPFPLPGESEPPTGSSAELPGDLPIPPFESDAKPNETADSTGPATPAAADAAAPDPVPVGGDDAPLETGINPEGNLLVRRDPERDRWWRLPAQEPLYSGDVVLALPTFRCRIALRPAWQMVLNGATSLRLNGPDADDVPRLEILYGQVNLRHDDAAEGRLSLLIDQRQHLVRFEGGGAEAVVRLLRELVPGEDPEAAPAPVSVHVFVRSGSVQWQAGQEAFAAQAPSYRIWDGTAFREVDIADSSPDWIGPEQLSAIEQSASEDVETELVTDRPVGVVLQELVDRQRLGRKIEVKSLAARCAVHVGNFAPFVEALNDPEGRPAWRPQDIRTLRDALALGPEVAGRIRESFQQLRGEDDGRELFRMLWGYDAGDLARGDREKLVSYLEHERLDYRLLALWNLIDITGYGSTDRLDDPKRVRRLIPRWKQRLADGEIVPREQR